MSFNAIRENEILAKISELTVMSETLSTLSLKYINDLSIYEITLHLSIDL